MKFILCAFLFPLVVHSEVKSLYLTKEQQKYYKNDSFEGLNQRERIDSLVVEVNNLHGELAKIRREMLDIRKELEEAKKK